VKRRLLQTGVPSLPRRIRDEAVHLGTRETSAKPRSLVISELTDLLVLTYLQPWQQSPTGNLVRASPSAPSHTAIYWLTVRLR
jgi:hypothetical protein